LKKVVVSLVRKNNLVLIGNLKDDIWEFPNWEYTNTETVYEVLVNNFNRDFEVEIKPLHQFGPYQFEQHTQIIPFICDYTKGKGVIGKYLELNLVKIPDLKEIKLTTISQILLKPLSQSYIQFFRVPKRKS
jgi:hypothetical protein